MLKNTLLSSVLMFIALASVASTANATPPQPIPPTGPITTAH
jgi:hypothetical protein